MSKDFYSVLAQELCSLKNSPFSMLSQNIINNESGLMNSSHIRKSNRLSFDPDRLFNPDKHKNNQDPEFIQFEKEQQQHLSRIEIQFLKEKTQQQLQKSKQKVDLSKGYSFQHPYSIFKSQRAVCMSCTKCYEYNGNFNIGVTVNSKGFNKQVQYLSCLTCGCPMNSHQPLYAKNKFSSEIFNFLANTMIQQSESWLSYYPMCFVKTKQSSLQMLMSNFLNYLPQLGFHVLSYRIMTKKMFQLFLVKNEILSGVEKDTVQKLLWFVSYLEHEDNWSWNQNMAQDAEQQYFELIRKIREKVKISISNEDQVIIFFVKNINMLEDIQLWQLMSHYSHLFRSKLLWTPSDPKKMFLSSCILFSEHFRLNHQIFVLPSQDTDDQMQKVAARFKDLLDYNNYVTIGQIKKIQTDKLEFILKSEDSNKMNYIMGRDQVNSVIKRVRILLTSKLGPSTFTIPFKNAIDFIQISSQNYSFALTFPEYLRSQRCVIILRPCFALSGLDEIIMTLLRINNFVLLKRRHVILTNQQAQYLATLQKIESSHLQSYVKMMTSGAVQIVLVSKRGAMYQANILLNGSKDSISDTKVKVLRDIPTFKVKRGTQSYEYTPTIKPYDSQKKQCFSSINELFRLQNILFPQQISQIKFMTNAKNGQVIKIDDEKKSSQQFKASTKLKQSMLTEIKKDIFNYWAYTSKSQFQTEQLAAIFMPETTLFQSCVVIVKPGFTHLTQKIAQSLIEHRYHIIMQKTVLLSQKLALQLIQNLSKTKASPHKLKKYVQAYSNQNIQIFCISKVYGKKQILSILKQFSFLSQVSTIVTEYVDDQLLKEVLVPVWNNQEFVLKILASPLYNIQEAIHSLYAPDTNNQEKFEILKYIIGSYYGVSIQDLSLKSIVGKFAYYITSFEVANLQSWFYSELSKTCSRYVPTLFQYRLIGQTCFVVQSDNGYPFLNLISTQYDQEKQKVNEVSHKDSRKNLILFLWGKQLAKFVHEVSQKDSSMKGWGRLTKKGQEWQGKTSQNESLRMQRDFLQQCEKKFQDNEHEIQYNVKKVLQSRYLTQKYHSSKKRIIPHFIEGKIDQCIRIIQTQQTSKLHLVDKYSMLDPDHQKSNQKSLSTLILYNVEPSIGTKVQLIVQIIVFLIKLEEDNLEYKEMFQLLLQYFVQNVINYVEVDLIESQLYIKLLKEYIATGEEWLKIRLRVWPNLKKLVSSISHQVDQISGKKRKFLQKIQYYKNTHSSLTQQQRHLTSKQYKNFNLNYEVQQKQFEQSNPLLNMKDPFHRKIALEQRTISLLRQNDNPHKQRTGIYVQFQKKITENEELLMTKVKGQVDRFNHEKQDKILYETGMDNQLWYRKTKGEKTQTKQGKLDDAIQKQISKFMQFKDSSSNNFYQTR